MSNITNASHSFPKTYDFFHSFQTPGCAINTKGQYSYLDPETGEIHQLHWLFGWLYLWTPGILIVSAVLILFILVISLVADWMRQREFERQQKALATNEVMLDKRVAKIRRSHQYDKDDTPTLRKKKKILQEEIRKSEQLLLGIHNVLATLREWDSIPPNEHKREFDLQKLNQQLAKYNANVNMDKQTGMLLDAPTARSRILSERTRLEQVIKDYKKRIHAMPPIYEAVKPRFYGEYLHRPV